MANNGTTQGAPWPMPKFRFSVDWGTIQTGISFQGVSGLEAETQILEYRDSDSPIFSIVKMPGIARYGNVTMKRGVFANDDLFWTWYHQIQMNTILRQAVVIKLLDQTGGTVATWTLNNAWPTKISSTDLKSDGNEVAIDTIEIVHEGLTIAYGS